MDAVIDFWTASCLSYIGGCALLLAAGLAVYFAIIGPIIKSYEAASQSKDAAAQSKNAATQSKAGDRESVKG